VALSGIVHYSERIVHLTSPLERAEQVSVYLQDTYLTEATTAVAATGRFDDGTAWIAVRDNPLHPQGGGQPADRGWVNDCEVVPVRQADSGLVVARAHQESTRGVDGLAEGDAVVVRVDAELRRLHAALHTAGHLVEAAGRTFGWELAGSIHFPGQARIEFTPGAGAVPEPHLREEAAERLNAWIAAAIADDVPVSADHDADGRRVVRLGGLHSAPCGGTHVRSLGMLDEATVTAVKVKKGRIKVSYSASHRR